MFIQLVKQTAVGTELENEVRELAAAAYGAVMYFGFKMFISYNYVVICGKTAYFNKQIKRETHINNKCSEKQSDKK